MQKVFIYSLLLLLGLAGSQFIPSNLSEAVRIATMLCLSFIMIHVGYEFKIDKKNMRSYGWDYFVAATAAAFPWIFCALYFVFVFHPSNEWWTGLTWETALLSARFASPTSAGVLFAMLEAAGLAATWTFQKAKVLAIFDDVDTVLLMVPLQIMMVGLKWQLGLVIVLISIFLWFGWKFYRQFSISTKSRSILLYALGIVGFSEIFYFVSQKIDSSFPLHVEVLLPAFALGCAIKHTKEHVEQTKDALDEMIPALFMLFVGLSMPALKTAMPEGQEISWGIVSFHLIVVTFLINLGKMFPAFCYRKEASFRERLALAVAMFPRGEVGAGVLVISISYGILGLPIIVAMLSLALNLILTGLIIVVVKKLIQIEK